ncbi:alkaline phosphatase [Gulosibacter sp. 10]|uniref:alkaline phosphatase n=1 Tax=Gulosibacter sp. 10 TaxID=1255570 RepID=UPI00097E991E|nr:alkaline phosphatase [Gulosibacter sp. 10]SJM71513.1 Alkaline phosphatase [Gulosibacter sp. 10]
MKLGKFSKPLVAGGLTVALAGAGTAFAAPAMADADVSPKNVIVLIGDGMGYNHIDFMNAKDTGETHWQVQRGGDNKVIPAGQNTAPEGWQAWDHVGMSTHWHDGPVYDPQQSWTDFEWNKNSPTDSAAAGTAMATGHKTYNAGLGVDYDGNVVENLSERALELDKGAGVVSSVPYSHATPAAYSSHAESRNDYHDIANQQIYGDLDVVIGTAHPYYTDDNEPQEQGDFTYISEEDWNAVSGGETDRTFIETNEDFEALTTGDTPDQVFGTPQVATTLQQARSEGADFNDVPDLSTLSLGALNVLDENENGFMLMIEGGAIDWTGHANESDRNLEEVRDFDEAVNSVVDWVETNSSWDETLVMVTADHETGYLYGPTEGDFSPIIPTDGDVQFPEHSWNSPDHTNMLVPLFFKGPGSEQLNELADQRDLLRGHYLDNVEPAQWLLNEAWVVDDSEPEPTEPEPTDDAAPEPTDSADPEPTDSTEPTPTEDDSDEAEGNGSAEGTGSADGKGNEAGDKGGDLAKTGAEGLLPLGIAAAVLLLIGAAIAMKARRGIESE